MANWVLTGLRTGIKTSVYPSRADEASGLSPGQPLGASLPSEEEAEILVGRCPAGAIARRDGGVSIDHGRCVHCFRCHRSANEPSVPWTGGYEWAAPPSETATARNKLDQAFGRSLHIRFVDAGACGACVSEARQLNNPYYNMHRLGFFITPTPRAADILLVAGPVSDAMRLPLLKAYEAMPRPKRVMAIGACAISGGVFGPSFIASGGVAEIIPVDVVVPGCPPPPLAILHGLLVLVERKPPSELVSPLANANASQT
jgi:Ni,Fe-hydrogenase III small subunit